LAIIVCVSDTHGLHAKLSVPAGDVVIHAGDFVAYGDTPKEIIDFNPWLGKQPHRFKVVLAGNAKRDRPSLGIWRCVGCRPQA